MRIKYGFFRFLLYFVVGLVSSAPLAIIMIYSIPSIILGALSLSIADAMSVKLDQGSSNVWSVAFSKHHRRVIWKLLILVSLFYIIMFFAVLYLNNG